MSNLLIVDLPQNDNSFSLSRNEAKDILGGDTCVCEKRTNDDGTYLLVCVCRPD
jgi:hypothetical protein